MDAYLRDKFGRFVKGSPQPHGFKKGNIPWNKWKFKANIAVEEVKRLYHIEHKTVKEIAEMFGYRLEILGRRPEKERFIKLINPCIKNLRATTPDW
jgi:hypothetical protein